jgi:spermidine/putrescine transport system permease protein
MLRGLYWGVIALLALPLGLIALTSLSDSVVVGFPLGAPTLRWYGAALMDRAFRQAFVLSVWLAAGSAILAVAAGTWIALAAAEAPRWLRLVLMGGALIPLVTPGLVHAIALRTAMQMIGLAPGALAILLGHTIHATPFAAIMVAARRASLPPDLVDAARDLGAGPIATFTNIIAPWLRPALLGAGALSALSSFDDFIRSFFLGGYDATLPVLVFGRLRSGLTPDINAVSTLVLIAACALGVMADLMSYRANQRKNALWQD